MVFPADADRGAFKVNFVEAGAVAAIHVAGVVIVPAYDSGDDHDVWEESTPP